MSLGAGSAVLRLQGVKEQLPAFVLQSLQRIQRSQEILANAGEPDAVNDINSAEMFTEGAYYDYEYTCDGPGISSLSEFTHTERVTIRASQVQLAFLHAYIESVKATYAANHDAAIVLSTEERALKLQDPDLHIPVASSLERQQHLDTEVEQLNREQRSAYEAATAHIAGQTGRQMIMFMSGEGGTGKSKVIGAISTFTQLLHGKTVGSWGAVLKTAPTGCAAHNIGGSTWHSALNKAMPGKAPRELTASLSADLQRKALGTVLFVLDEISLLCAEDLFDISRRLGLATGRTGELFGGLHTLLVGDFYQMRPVGGVALVSSKIPEYKPNAIKGRAIIQSSLTDYHLLKTNVRASCAGSNAPNTLALLCSRIRLADMSDAILQSINDRVVNTVAAAMRTASPAALWITSTHSRVAAINDEFMTKRQENNETMYTIIARHVPQRESAAPLTADIRKKLYAERGDPKGDRNKLMLSYINLFVGSRVRLTRNLFVEGGLFNGAMGTVWGFVFRGDGVVPTDISGNRRLYGDMDDREREIPVVLVQMDGDEHSFTYSCSTSVPRLVPIVATQSAELVCGEYVRLQVPLLPAEARTAHSVQGLTAHHGVVIDPGSIFFAGDYTALSRATSKDKVILLAPFQEVHFTGHAAYRKQVLEEYSRLEQSFPQL
jgi:hypothetical protein